MKIKAGIPALILSAVILLSGCSLGINDPSLLNPPKTTGREAQLESLISQTANGNYKLKYPQSGEYRSAIITEDLNGDKKDEAIAFYHLENDEKNTYALVMYDTGKNWKISDSFKVGHTDVDCVQFADYDYDGVEEIFTGFLITNSPYNELNIFDYSPEKHKTDRSDFSLNYSIFTTGDYDQDGGSEILSFNLSSNENEASAVLTDYDKNKLYTLSSCPMDRNVTKFDNTESGLINKDTMGVAVDGILEKGYNSQVIYYNSQKRRLFNYPMSTSKNQNITSRAEKIHCTDIDHDGFIEIPVITGKKTDSNSKSIAPLISWSGLNTKTNKLTTKVKCISDFEFGYYFKLPENFSDTTTAFLSDDSRTMQIYSDNSVNSDKLIATFKVFDVGTSPDDMNGYSTLESYNQYIYTYKIEENSPVSISGDTLKENFALNDLGA